MSKPTILYAEDIKESRENYAIILKEHADAIYLAENGKEALELYRQHQPDIVILDIKMPLVDGIEVSREIRAVDPNVPIIMLTAYADKETLLQAIDLKLDKFLVKPVEMPDLIETVKYLTEQLSESKKIPLVHGLLWDGNDQKLFLHENEIKLTKKERQLVQLLASNAGSYYSHDQLIIHIWEDELPDHTYNKKLIQLIYRLNKKIADLLSIHSYFIENSYNLGYRIEAAHSS